MTKCSVIGCDKKEGLVKHHLSYQPEIMVPLCPSHHAQAHVKEKRENREAGVLSIKDHEVMYIRRIQARRAVSIPPLISDMMNIKPGDYVHVTIDTELKKDA